MRTQALEKIVKGSIIQDAKMKQFLGHAKGVQVCIQINGDKAIDRACASNGDLKGALMHILERLPEPRMFFLQCLALIVAQDEFRSYSEAGRYLGVSRNRFYREDRPYPKGMRRLREEFFRDEDSRRLSQEKEHQAL